MVEKNGEWYDWDQMKKEFPDKWVVVENAELDRAKFIKAGNLIAVCDDNEIDNFIIKCHNLGKHIDYRRTVCKGITGVMKG